MAISKKQLQTAAKPEGRYVEAVGRRKTAVARVRLFAGSLDTVVVNGKNFEAYFPLKEQRLVALSPFKSIPATSFGVTVQVRGGGLSAQAEALRHGLARALCLHDASHRKIFKELLFLKRDPRAKERRKFGLKKARKAPQWAKR